MKPSMAWLFLSSSWNVTAASRKEYGWSSTRSTKLSTLSEDPYFDYVLELRAPSAGQVTCPRPETYHNDRYLLKKRSLAAKPTEPSRSNHPIKHHYYSQYDLEATSNLAKVYNS
ncbi:hypothetical protein BDR22DRAFT_816863 [Usnea florida]